MTFLSVQRGQVLGLDLSQLDDLVIYFRTEGLGPNEPHLGSWMYTSILVYILLMCADHCVHQ